MEHLIREKYLQRIRPFYRDSGVIKIIIGPRRCGKSVLMKQIRDELVAEGVAEGSIAYVDLDSKAYRQVSSPEALERIVDSRLPSEGERFLFVDEIQNINGYEGLVNAYRNDGVSVFLTGSNSYLLSGELATKLTGRYVEFPVWTLSFSEVREHKENNGIPFEWESAFDDYIVLGGYPKRFEYTDPDAAALYVRSVVDETIGKDILGSKRVRNKDLMARILNYLISTPGAEISTPSIADYLRSERIRTAPSTVGRYLDMIFSSRMASKCERLDIRGKGALRTLYRSYVSDTSIYTQYPSTRTDLSMGRVLETVVHNELVSRGYEVHVGKLYGREVDFVVTHRSKRAYVQVAYHIGTDEILEREEAPLLSIKDGFPKYIVSMDTAAFDHKGIRRLHLVKDLLLGDGFRI